MATQIKSRSDLFRGEMVDKPLPSIVIAQNEDGEDIYECPQCHFQTTAEDCGVVGAEPNCLFCPKCSCEFEV